MSTLGLLVIRGLEAACFTRSHALETLQRAPVKPALGVASRHCNGHRGPRAKVHVLTVVLSRSLSVAMSVSYCSTSLHQVRNVDV